MNEFSFVGSLSGSKSIFNRALVAQSFQPDLELVGHSQAEDVLAMRQALKQLSSNETMDCAQAGTVFRFMALRAAREEGRHFLTGHPRLLARPQQELDKILGQLGCQVEQCPTGLSIRSWGWKMAGDALHVPTDRSSQFASGVILSAWQLPFDLCVWLGQKPVSEGYLDMTLALVRQLGMQVERRQNELRVPRGQKIRAQRFEIEPDLSSLFALAACAAVKGHIRVRANVTESWQPDRWSLSLMREMGVPLQVTEDGVNVERATRLQPLDVDLTGAPDLFPVLAALAALADGTSRLRGAPQLAHKESNRRDKMAELLRLCGRDVEVNDSCFTIHGKPSLGAKRAFDFDPDQDHRLAFAATVLQMSGEPLEILHPHVVEKSFPEFWQVLGVAT